MAWELTDEQHRQIRHMPMVLEHIAGLATDMRKIVDDLCQAELTSKSWKGRRTTGHFGVLVQTHEGGAALAAWDQVVEDNPDHSRPRAYVHPIDGKGIRIEMTHHVLLKAAAAMGGK
jgi:hypothetical protein